MSNHEIGPHTRGESLFVVDLPVPPGLLHAAVLPSPIPHGKIVRLDTTPAAEIDGVACVLTAADIPGENQIGGIVQDEPLLAEGEVHFAGQPIVAVIADTPRRARQAAAAIKIEFEERTYSDGVEELVRDIMAAGKPHGRFIIMPTAAPIDISLAQKTERNYIRFIETALETGRYH